MKIKQYLLIVVVLLATTPTTNAQFGKLKKRVQNKLEQKANQKINQKIDKEIDKAIDPILEGKSKKGENGNESPNYDFSKMGYETYDLSGSYDYQFKIDWEVTTEKGDPMEMSQMLSDDGKHFAMEIQSQKRKKNETGIIIYDMEQSEIIILVEAEKQAIITTSINAEEVIEETYEEEKDFNFTKTGKKKQILGYTCERYTYSSEDGKGEVWITKDLKYSNYDFYKFMQQNSKRKEKQSMPVSWEKVKDGFALESINIDKDGNKVTMLAKNIDENANIKINVDGYKAMKVTGMPQMGKN